MLSGTKRANIREPENRLESGVGETDEVASLILDARLSRGSQTIIAIRDALIEIDAIGFPRTGSLWSRSDRPLIFCPLLEAVRSLSIFWILRIAYDDGERVATSLS